MTVTVFVQRNDYVDVAHNDPDFDWDPSYLDVFETHTFVDRVTALTWVDHNVFYGDDWCLDGATSDTALVCDWPRWFGPEPAPVRRPRTPR